MCSSDLLASLKENQASAPSVARSAPPPSPSPASSVPPARYTRLMLAPGLELHVSRDARLPKTPAEQDALARQLIAALDTLRRTP